MTVKYSEICMFGNRDLLRTFAQVQNTITDTLSKGKNSATNSVPFNRITYNIMPIMSGTHAPSGTFLRAAPQNKPEGT